jgi:hypothetical protein
MDSEHTKWLQRLSPDEMKRLRLVSFYDPYIRKTRNLHIASQSRSGSWSGPITSKTLRPCGERQKSHTLLQLLQYLYTDTNSDRNPQTRQNAIYSITHSIDFTDEAVKGFRAPVTTMESLDIFEPHTFGR